MTSYALIVNAMSGRGRALRRAQELREHLGPESDVTILETTHRGAAVELAKASVGAYDRVIAVGGDGTLNEVLNGLLASNRRGNELPELGFLKAGTANAAVPALGLAKRPKTMARALMTGTSRFVDVGLCRHTDGERAFLLWCGAGWDGLVIHTLNAQRTGHMGLWGLAQHGFKLLKAIRQYPQPIIETSVDGQSMGRFSTVVTANVDRIAFGCTVAEHADPSDGQLNVIGLPRASLFRLLRLSWTMKISALGRARGVCSRAGAEMSLASKGDVPIQIDGEPVGYLPATITILPRAVRLLGVERLQ